MKGFIKSVLIFMAGAICGGSYVYRHFTKLDKSKSEKTVFEASGDPAASPTELSRALDEIDPLDVIEEALLKKIIREQGYSSAEICVISEDEFGDNGFETITLIYYADDVLTDDNDDIIEDIEETLGDAGSLLNGLKDALYVRNEKRGCDYEVLPDLRRYSDVVQR